MSKNNQYYRKYNYAESQQIPEGKSIVGKLFYTILWSLMCIRWAENFEFSFLIVMRGGNNLTLNSDSDPERIRDGGVIEI